MQYWKAAGGTVLKKCRKKEILRYVEKCLTQVPGRGKIYSEIVLQIDENGGSHYDQDYEAAFRR